MATIGPAKAVDKNLIRTPQDAIDIRGIHLRQLKEQLQGTDSRGKLTDIDLDTLAVDTINPSTSGGSITFNAPITTASSVDALTQATSITTAVDSNNTASGVITTQSATAAAGATQTFQLNNTLFETTSNVQVTIVDYAGTFTTNGLPFVTVDALSADGNAQINVHNAHGTNALSGALKIAYTINN